jgi:hypothetical protein
LLVTFGAYVGGYYLLLEEGGFLTGEPDPGVLLDLRPDYRYGGSYTTSIFAPVHWTDRQLRPGRWSIQIDREDSVD